MPSMIASIQIPPTSMLTSVYCPPFYRFNCLLCGMGLLVTGCKTPLPPAAYRAYLADPAHGLTQTIEAGGATITCVYRPTELLVLQDLAGQPAPPPATRDSLARAYAGKTYCTLTFSHNGQELENQFISQPLLRQRVVDYLQKGITADVFLATAPGDSVPAAASFYVQQYGISGHSTVVLVFTTPRLRLAQGFHLTLRGQTQGLGDHRFFFTSHDLGALPPLRFE
jgi:hypothetical protein